MPKARWIIILSLISAVLVLACSARPAAEPNGETETGSEVAAEPVAAAQDGAASSSEVSNQVSTDSEASASTNTVTAADQGAQAVAPEGEVERPQFLNVYADW